MCRTCGGVIKRVTRITREYCSDVCYAERKRVLRKTRPVPICPSCNKEFVRNSNRQKWCGLCKADARSAYSTAYVAKNISDIRSVARKSAQKFRAENPETVVERDRRWRAANAKLIRDRKRSAEYRAKAAAYQRKKNANPHWKIRNRMHTAIGQSLRGCKSGRSWEKLVGYTLVELVAHLESKFLPGMTWGNIGKWHIDHKIPRAAFSYTATDDFAFKECWALTNLQPLWALDNFKKGAKMPDELRAVS